MRLGARIQATAPSGTASLEDILAFVERELRSAAARSLSADRPSTVFMTLPAPHASVAPLLAEDAYVAVWTSPDGASTVGLGRTFEITAAGSDRVARIRERAASLWPNIARSTYPGIEPLSPRLFGGFAFTAGAAEHEPWQEFGDARFVLPAFVYSCTTENNPDGTRSGAPADGYGMPTDGARLALCVTTPDQRGESDALSATSAKSHIDAWIARQLDELARVFHALTRTNAADDIRSPGIGGRLVASTEMTDAALWRRQIRDIRRTIDDAQCDKIVAARCRRLQLSQRIDPASVLGSLERRYPDCHRFAFCFGGASWFVGASPERLIARAGERISTQALAGSIAARAGSDARASASSLLASRKDRSEQGFVVQAIRTALEPWCSRLDVPREPIVRELRDVLHLETPITGILRQPVHVLDLLAALHPTPAVGGVPTERALAWIADNEPMPRGWYAAPVGYFDARGQGEFAVAIRSGLLRDREAFIYVGAGIVHDSDADAELAETELKQRALLGALGIEP